MTTRPKDHVHRERTASATFISEKELAERHDRSVKTIRNERLRGCGVPFVKIGRSVRYRLSDVLDYEHRQTRRSTTDKGDC